MYKLSKLIQLTEQRQVVTPPSPKCDDSSAPSVDSKDQMPYEEFVSEIMDQLNKMLEHLNSQMEKSIFEIQEKVVSLHGEASVKFG